MSNKRHLRLAEAYLKELSGIMCNRIRDPRLSGVYVTQVIFTPDLRLAKIYFNMSGGRVRENEVIEGFERCKGFIKKEVGQRVNIKNTPDLKFYYDNTDDEKDRIDHLFEQIEQENDTSEKH